LKSRVNGELIIDNLGIGFADEFKYNYSLFILHYSLKKGVQHKGDVYIEAFTHVIEENPFEKGFSSNSFPKTSIFNLSLTRYTLSGLNQYQKSLKGARGNLSSERFPR